MKTFGVFAMVALLLVSTADARSYKFPSFFKKRECSGKAKYAVTFFNNMFPERFEDIPNDASLVFSPLTGASHIPRISVLVLRGFASKGVEQIAEEGTNTILVEELTKLRDNGNGIKTIAAADGPTMVGKRTTVEYEVDCENNYITVLSMVAPSPDWIVAVANFNVLRDGRFISYARNDLFAYDAGTDSGGDLTPPNDLSLDEPTVPAQNIAPLSEDPTDRFGGKSVGYYEVKRIE